jgi:hypothetical protein
MKRILIHFCSRLHVACEMATGGSGPGRRRALKQRSFMQAIVRFFGL